MKHARSIMLFTMIICLVRSAAPAHADTLYVAAPPPSGPGHPLRLGPDLRASQVGDLVYVQYDFNSTTVNSQATTNKKDYNMNLGAGTGNLAFSLLRFPTSTSGGTSSDSTHTQNGTTQITTTLMAKVTNVMPSGTLEIQGDQQLKINGDDEVLHIKGYVRTADIDNTDTVLASHVADVTAVFNGNDKSQHTGLLHKLMDALF